VHLGTQSGFATSEIILKIFKQIYPEFSARTN
jgi:hypothetical protein